MPPVLLGLSLVDLAVVAGIALVLPACLGGPWRRWALAAGAVALACTFDQGSGPAVLLALVWPAVGALVTVDALRAAGSPRTWSRQAAVHLLACGYSLVAAGWLVLSRAGATPMGIHEPIVELTTVHFTYVGVGALVLADAALAATTTTAGRRLGWAAVTLTAGAPPVVALGFVTGAAVPQVGGAVLMSLGVYATAGLQLAQAVRLPLPARSRALLLVSGLAVWAPMVLAVFWAAAHYVDVPALSIPDMVRVHGMLNAVGFVGAGLLARRPPGVTVDAPARAAQIPEGVA